MDRTACHNYILCDKGSRPTLLKCRPHTLEKKKKLMFEDRYMHDPINVSFQFFVALPEKVVPLFCSCFANIVYKTVHQCTLLQKYYCTLVK